LGGAYKDVQVPGLQPAVGHSTVRINFNVVGPGYFSLIGTRLLRGRVFDTRDTPAVEKVVVINETMARRFWPGEEPIGRSIHVANDQCWIVGVVEDTKWETLTEEPRPLLYFPTTQQVSDSLTILLRARVDPASLVGPARAALGRIDTNVPLLSAITLKQHMAFTLSDERNRALLSSVFAVLGIILAAAGLYGVIAFLVARRTREIGIRMAIGAAPTGVIRLVLSRVAMLVGVGIVIGAVVSAWAATFVASLLYGVEPRDPVTFVGATAILVAVGAVAGWLPAWRASRIDPAEVLRAE
jgi:predicted permease